jgi:hypothetical protein
MAAWDENQWLPKTARTLRDGLPVLQVKSGAQRVVSLVRVALADHPPDNPVAHGIWQDY